MCVKKPTNRDYVSSGSYDSLKMPSWREEYWAATKFEMAQFNMCWRATRIRRHICTPGHQLHDTKPSEDSDQPSFPAHSVELSPLCDEVGRRVHLSNVASVHDDHSVEQRKKKKMGFRCSIFNDSWSNIHMCGWAVSFEEFWQVPITGSRVQSYTSPWKKRTRRRWYDILRPSNI